MRCALIIFLAAASCIPAAAQTPQQARLQASPQAHVAFANAGLAADIDVAYPQIESLCKGYRPCVERNVEAFGRLTGHYPDASPGHRARMLRILAENTKDGITNWQWAGAAYFEPFDMERAKPIDTSITTDCRAEISKDGRNVRATCTTR